MRRRLWNVNLFSQRVIRNYQRGKEFSGIASSYILKILRGLSKAERFGQGKLHTVNGIYTCSIVNEVQGILGDSQFLHLKIYFEDFGKPKGLAGANFIL